MPTCNWVILWHTVAYHHHHHHHHHVIIRTRQEYNNVIYLLAIVFKQISITAGMYK